MGDTYFESLNLSGWRQFKAVSIDLRAPITILTGPNGCGKTTILNVLGRHFGWNLQFVSSPSISRRGRRLWTDIHSALKRGDDASGDGQPVGSIRYSTGAECSLLAPATSESAQYHLTYRNQANVDGINIPSHRPIATYFPIATIPTNPKDSDAQFQEFQQLLIQVYGADRARNPGAVLKQSLISFAVFGYGNEVVRANDDYRRVFEGFQNVLREILPSSIGFRRIEVRMPEVVLLTKSGDFPLDAMSGGVSALFAIAWQIHMHAVRFSSGTILIDEPENHLHPSMQREFLPALQRAFPGHRFVVATHSPFIVTSSASAAVYGLVYEDELNSEETADSALRRVVSRRLESADLSGSPNKILRDILDVPTTLPVWVEDRVNAVLQKYSASGLTEQAAEAAYRELKELGLSDAVLGMPERNR